MKNNKTLSKNFKFIINFAILLTLVFTGVEGFCNYPQNTVFAVEKTVINKELSENKMVEPSFDKKEEPAKNKENPNGFLTTVIKFLSAMLGVLLSSFAIFLGLKFYKKFILKNHDNADTISYDKNLESPKDFKEAINLFLEKTDKE